MLVTRVKQIKEETIPLMKLEDLEGPVIETMGVDVWDAIVYFHAVELEKLEKEIEEVIESNPQTCDLIQLRKDAEDCVKELEKLIDEIKNASRLQRLVVIDRLRRIKSDLALSEGML